MSRNWQHVRLVDVCESVMDCVNKTAPAVEFETPYRMIRTTNVRNGYVNLETVKYVEEETYKKWIRRQTPQVGDVILTREAPLGEVGLLRDAEGVFLGQRLMSYRANEKLLDRYYLLYTLMSHEVQGQIRGYGSGSTVEHMRVGDAENITIPLPPLPLQRRIGAVLIAYDNLIENNTRRIKLLEQMAQLIYQEWFVDFRFPGHEDVEMVESELGPVPEGWRTSSVSAAVELNPGLSPAKGREKVYVPMAGLSTDSMLVTEFETRTSNSGSKFQNNDTLFARITPSIEHGKTGFVQFLSSEGEVAVGSTEFIVMRSRTLNPYFVYGLARVPELRQHAINSMSGASGRQRVQMQCFDNYFFAHPTHDVLEKFANLAAPIFRSIHTLSQKNQNLRQTRDMLLPKLISGELDVSELAEVQETAEAAA